MDTPSYPNDFWPEKKQKSGVEVAIFAALIIAFMSKFVPVNNGGGGAKSTKDAIKELAKKLSELQAELDARREEVNQFLDNDLMTALSAKVYGIARALDAYKATGREEVVIGAIALTEETTNALETVMSDRPRYLSDESSLVLEDLLVASLAQRAVIYATLNYQGLKGDEVKRVTDLLLSVYKEGNRSAERIERKRFSICEAKLDPVYSGPNPPKPKLIDSRHWLYQTFVGYKTVGQSGCGPGKIVAAHGHEKLRKKIVEQRKLAQKEIDRIVAENVSKQRSEEISFIEKFGEH